MHRSRRQQAVIGNPLLAAARHIAPQLRLILHPEADAVLRKIGARTTPVAEQRVGRTGVIGTSPDLRAGGCRSTDGRNRKNEKHRQRGQRRGVADFHRGSLGASQAAVFRLQLFGLYRCCRYVLRLRRRASHLSLAYHWPTPKVDRRRDKEGARPSMSLRTRTGTAMPRGLGGHSSDLRKNELALGLSARKAGQPDPRGAINEVAAAVIEELVAASPSPAVGDSHVRSTRRRRDRWSPT